MIPFRSALSRWLFLGSMCVMFYVIGFTGFVVPKGAFNTAEHWRWTLDHLDIYGLQTCALLLFVIPAVIACVVPILVHWAQAGQK